MYDIVQHMVIGGKVGWWRQRVGVLRRRPRIFICAVALVFAGFGVYLLGASRAATPFLSVEPESQVGVNSGCATKVTDSTASGGQAVRFGACASADPNDPSTLDESGTVIPDSQYAIPSGAVFMATNGNDANAGTQTAPVRTINRAVDLAPSGGTIVVRGGTNASPAVYRDWYYHSNTSLNTKTFAVLTKSVTIQAYPNEKAWFDGTDVIPAASWTKESGMDRWSMSWSTPSFCGTLPTATTSNYYSVSLDSQRKGATGNDGRPEGTRNGPCAHRDASKDPANPMALDPQMVYINGKYVHQVESISSVDANNFYYDWTNKRIYIGADPAGKTVELAARPMFAQLNGAGSKVLGLGFKRYASHVYFNNPGAIYAGAGNQRYENVVFKEMAGYGLFLATTQTGNVVNRSVFVRNGANGINGGKGNVQILNSLFSGNNTELFWTNCYYSCNAANIKLHDMNGFVIKNNIIKNGQGKAIGVWCDITCINGVYANNIVYGNGNAGIMHEISDSAIIASNLVYNNKGAGIRVASANVKVYNNTVVNNSPAGTSESYQGNVWIYDDPRSPDNPDTGNTGAGAVGPDTTNVHYANNVLAADVRMDYYSGTRTDSTNTQHSQFFAVLNYNAYWRSAGSNQVLVRWSDAGGNTDYRSISAFAAARSWNANSVDVAGGNDPFFVNAAAGDYRLRSNNQAGTGTTIPADVLQAIGITSGTGLPKGAVTWPGKP